MQTVSTSPHHSLPSPRPSQTDTCVWDISSSNPGSILTSPGDSQVGAFFSAKQQMAPCCFRCCPHILQSTQTFFCSRPPSVGPVLRTASNCYKNAWRRPGLPTTLPAPTAAITGAISWCCEHTNMSLDPIISNLAQLAAAMVTKVTWLPGLWPWRLVLTEGWVRTEGRPGHHYTTIEWWRVSDRFINLTQAAGKQPTGPYRNGRPAYTGSVFRVESPLIIRRIFHLK